MLVPLFFSWFVCIIYSEYFITLVFFLVFSILLIFFLLLQLYRYSVFTTYALNITPNFKLLMNFFVHKTWTEKSGVYKFVLKQDQECELPINRGASLQCYMQLPRTLKCLWRGLGLGRWRTDFNVICGFSLWHPLTALKCCSPYQNGGLAIWLIICTNHTSENVVVRMHTRYSDNTGNTGILPVFDELDLFHPWPLVNTVTKQASA